MNSSIWLPIFHPAHPGQTSRVLGSPGHVPCSDLGRQESRMAWVSVALLLAISGTDLALSLTVGDGAQLADVVWLLGFSAFAILGGLIVGHQRSNRVGWLFLGAGLGTHTASLLTTVAEAAARTWL